MRELVLDAIDRLCDAFDRHGYNPTPIIDLGVLVAAADGKVDDKERAVLLDVFQSLLDAKLTPEVVDAMVSASLEVIQAAGAGPRARLVAEILNDCDAVEPGMMVALAVAFANEGLTAAEKKAVERISDAAGLPRERLEALTKELRAQGGGKPEDVRSALTPGPPSSRSGR
jgi:tellurite resistance protein